MDQDRVQTLSRPRPIIIIIIITMDTIILLALDLSQDLSQDLSLDLSLDLILAPQEKILEVAKEQSLVAAVME